jgi:predicted Rossmann fold nucleotide-binding protein DprA/Smf involved in DNA uptake
MIRRLAAWTVFLVNIFRLTFKEAVMQASQSIGVIGSRALPHSYSDQVGEVCEYLLGNKHHILTGGAVGADEFCLSRLLHLGRSERATVFSAWRTYNGFPIKVRAMLRQFKQYQGNIVWGTSFGKESYQIIRSALLQRNKRLVDAAHGLVAFLYKGSTGSRFTLSLAIHARRPVVIFPIKQDPPTFDGVKWRPLNCGGCWQGAFKAVYTR